MTTKKLNKRSPLKKSVHVDIELKTYCGFRNYWQLSEMSENLYDRNGPQYEMKDMLFRELSGYMDRWYTSEITKKEKWK